MSASEQPEAVFLDLDGTLVWVDSAAAVRATCSELGDRFGLAPDALVRANAEAFGPYFAAMETDWTLGRLSNKALSREAWRRTLEVVSCRDDSVVERAVSTFAEAFRANLGMYEDVAALLDAIPNSIPVGVITNGPTDAQHEKIRVVGLADRFDVIVTSADVGVAKPEPMIFVEALARLGVGSASAWHVGDSLSADVAGANGSGLVSVWVNRAGCVRTPTQPKAKYDVATLAAIPALWAASV